MEMDPHKSTTSEGSICLRPSCPLDIDNVFHSILTLLKLGKNSVEPSKGNRFN